MRVLLAGHIDLNVIDGSALFMTNLAALAASHPNVSVDLLSCKEITQGNVVRELDGLPNINVITPKEVGEARADETDTEPTCAQVLAEQALSGYDVVFVRDTLMAWEAVSYWGLNPSNLAVYVTGFTHFDRKPEMALVRALFGLEFRGVHLVFQTPEMLDWVGRTVFDRTVRRSFILMPSLPLLFSDLKPAWERCDGQPAHLSRGLRLAYVGKFFAQWAPVEQIAAFREFRRENKDATFTVAGDHFRASPKDPRFVQCVRYLLSNTKGLSWVGGVPRAQSRRIMMAADVGFSLRHKDLETSLEFSSKVLEYGASGLAVILNRTAMHERLLGSDYPLFAGSITDAVDALQEASDSPETLALARRRCVELAQSRSFETGALELAHLFTLIAGDRSLRSAKRNGGIYRDPTNPEMIVGLDLLDPKARDLALLTDCPSPAIRTKDAGSPVLTLSEPLWFPPENAAPPSESVNQSAVVNAEAWDLATRMAVKTQGKKGSDPKTPPTPRGQKAPTKEDEKQKRRIADLEKQLSLRERELEGSRKRLATSNDRLQALRSSKLGGLQVRWWQRLNKKKH